jgi:hypothetical protein
MSRTLVRTHMHTGVVTGCIRHVGSVQHVRKPRCHKYMRLRSSAGQSAGVAAGSVVQIGALTIATYAVELLLERGFVFAVGTLLYQFLQGGSRPHVDLLCSWWSSAVLSSSADGWTPP